MTANIIYNSLERLGELLKVSARQSMAEHGLQPIQLEVLHYLSSCNQFSDTPMAVTEYLGQTKGTVSQTLKVLEKKQFINKVADVKDKRISHLKVTEKGNELIQENIPTKFIVEACKNLSLTQKNDISLALEQLLLSVVKSNNMKSFGICHSCRYHQKNDDGSYFCQLVKVPLTEKDISLVCREHETNQ
jgi:DNA-binding MarR family transcriptional regulator